MLVIFSFKYKCLCCLLIVKLQKHKHTEIIMTFLSLYWPLLPSLLPTPLVILDSRHCTLYDDNKACVFTTPKKRKETKSIFHNSKMRFVIQLIRSTTLFFRWTTIFRVCVALYMIRFPNGFGPNHTFNIFNILKMEIKKERTNVNTEQKHFTVQYLSEWIVSYCLCCCFCCSDVVFFMCHFHLQSYVGYLHLSFPYWVHLRTNQNSWKYSCTLFKYLYCNFCTFFYEKSLTLHVFSFTGCKWAFLHSVRHTIHLLIFEWLFLGDLIDILFSSLSHKHTHTLTLTK